MGCAQIQEHLGALADDELEPSPMLEFERHLDGCEECRADLAATRLVKAAVAEAEPRGSAPASLKLRMGRALDEADRAETVRRLPNLFTGLALAAAVLLAVGVGVDGVQMGAMAPTVAATLPIVQQVVDSHVHQLPSEIKSPTPERVASWFRGKLGFRLRPVGFGRADVRFMGARVSNVGAQRAAALYYRVGKDRLTVVAFRAPDRLREALRQEREEGRDGVHRVRIGDQVVTYHNVHDYTVPMIERNGVVYAFTGDLDRGNLLRLVASVRLP